LQEGFLLDDFIIAKCFFWSQAMVLLLSIVASHAFTAAILFNALLIQSVFLPSVKGDTIFKSPVPYPHRGICH
jgi:hypothetical protein